ncbi:hypothetical protein POM88_034272 [Heracleum sosnowskyi]|uniref:Uncharacterized protein n=1 Tax=Heracleum sosnowskyi TaxID=360622 RepID=A0AAD8HIY5_9APIA|nr:hypothetical protein POM88_034272 [Heracleum sosnowskyi]
MGIRKDLHPVLSSDGESYEIRAAIFDMTNKEKEIFCSVLENVKSPYGCASSIRRYVHTKERKITGYKSHDAHFILHYLLQFAVKKTLKPEVALPMIRLGAFLRGLWAKTQVKRTFVTTHQLQQQKNKKATEVLNSPRRSARMNDLQVNSPRRSSRLNNQEVNSRRRSPCGDAAQKVVDATVNLNAACVKRKLDLCNPPNAYEEMGDTEAMAEDEEDDEEIRESESEGLPPPPLLTNYEKERFVNVTFNDAVYKLLGLPTLAKDFNGEMKKSKKKVQIREECSEYVPGAEEHVGDDVAEKPRKRTKKAFKTKLPGGPTTRSRSNPVTAPQKETAVKDAGKSILVEPAEQIQLPQSGLGTMADYLILRDRQKKENAEKKAAVASGSGTARQPVDGENVLPDIGDDEAEEG